MIVPLQDTIGETNKAGIRHASASSMQRLAAWLSFSVSGAKSLAPRQTRLPGVFETRASWSKMFDFWLAAAEDGADDDRWWLGAVPKLALQWNVYAYSAQ